MPSTSIPAPRTPPFDETGRFSREWYIFFYNLFNLVLQGNNTISIQDVLVQPQFDPAGVAADLDRAQLEQLIVNTGTQDQFAQVIKELNALKIIASEQKVSSEIVKRINALECAPVNLDTVVNRTGDTMPGSLGVGGLTVNTDSLRVTTAKTPATAAATGTAGQIAWDTNYIYVCVATDTWKRVAISTW